MSHDIFHVDYVFHCVRSNSRATCYIRVRTHLDGYLRISKRYRYVYKHTQPLGVRSFSSREGDGNVMQMGFCGENFRRQREEREKEREREREREDRKERGRILGRVEAGRISLLRLLPPRDRPRARIIFTEIKSKIRLALKCALDRARPNRRWLSKRRRCLYPGARRRLVRSGCEDPTRTRGYTRDEKQRKIDRGRRFGGLNRRNSLLMQIGDS